MVQVLPAVPTFGSKLADVLTKAGGDVSRGYIQRNQNRSDEKILQEFNPDNQSPLETLKMFTRLSPNTQSRLTPLVTQYVKSQGQNQMFQQKQQEAQQQQQEVQTQELQEELEAEDLFKRLEEHIPYTGSTKIPFTKSFEADSPNMAALFGNSKGVQGREYFNTTALELEKYARQQYTKGTLSAQVFNRLMESLPNAELSETQNKGRLKAFKDIIINSKKKAKAAARAGVKSDNKPERPPLEEIFK